MIKEDHSKVMSMKDAVREFVQDGATVFIGGFIHGDPFAAVHEIIRQKKRDLTVSCAAGTIILDQLIGAGCVKRAISSYIWNPMPTSAHAFRRALEKGIPHHIEVDESSLLALNLAYFAGALGLPFVATKTLLGSDLVERGNSLAGKKLKIIESPFTGEKVCLIPPLKHDVGILQVQRSDVQGNFQAWGLLGPTKYGINSCSKIIVCVEEIVDNDVIRRDPNRTITPGFRVSSVVEEPWGSQPSYIQGYYDRDWKYFSFYDKISRSLDGFEEYLEEWIYGVKDRKDYLKKIGEERLSALKVNCRDSSFVSYGHYDIY